MIFRYDDDSVFEGEWEDAPGYGLQTIAYVDPIEGPTLRHQGSYFRLDEDGDIVPIDDRDLMRWLVDDLKLIKVGSMVSRHKWKEIYQHAREDLAEIRERTD